MQQISSCQIANYTLLCSVCEYLVFLMRLRGVPRNLIKKSKYYIKLYIKSGKAYYCFVTSTDLTICNCLRHLFVGRYRHGILPDWLIAYFLSIIGVCNHLVSYNGIYYLYYTALDTQESKQEQLLLIQSATFQKILQFWVHTTQIYLKVLKYWRHCSHR